MESRYAREADDSGNSRAEAGLVLLSCPCQGKVSEFVLGLSSFPCDSGHNVLPNLPLNLGDPKPSLTDYLWESAKLLKQLRVVLECKSLEIMFPPLLGPLHMLCTLPPTLSLCLYPYISPFLVSVSPFRKPPSGVHAGGPSPWWVGGGVFPWQVLSKL